MTANIDDRYLTGEPFRDDLGTGIRLYTDRDEVYEARTVAGSRVRVHGGDAGWYVQAQLPASTEPVEGYETFDTVTERLEHAYGAELITPATDFLDRLESRDSFTASDDGMQVQYRKRHAWKLEPGECYSSSRYSADQVFRMTGAGAGTGAAGGVTIGATAGPEAALALGVLGGVGGAVVGLMDRAFLYDMLDSPISLSKGTEKGADWTLRKKHEFTEQRANRQKRLDDADLFDRFNEKQRLKAVADKTRDPHQAERFRELRDSDIEERVENLLERQFDRFDERQGVTAQYTADGYGEALDFAATVLETGAMDLERPSLFQDRDVFQTVFEAADEGRQEELVEAVLARDDADQQVTGYLEDSHGETVEQVGQERTLTGDAG